MRILYRITLCAIGLLLLPFQSYTQDINREIIKNNIGKNIYEAYPEANALILYEKGSVEVVRSTNRFEQIYRVHEIVKILKTPAFDLANVSDVYQNDDNFHSHAENVIGATYNWQDGRVVKIPLEKSAVFNQKLNESFYEFKFTLPAVKEGSIIEYSYDIRSDLSVVARPWRFQSEYPALTSEYEIICPSGFQYVYVTQGTPAFKKIGSIHEANADSISAYQLVTPTVEKGTSVLWGRKNVSAIFSEPYISTEVNHTERIDVQLSTVNLTGSLSDKHEVMNTWENFNEAMLMRYGRYYGNKNNFLNQAIEELTKGAETPYEKSRRIFKFIRSGYNCTDTIAPIFHTEIEKVFKNRTGNAAELNLLLVAMLRKAGINASPVLLSTLGNLKADPIYPLVNRFNHLVCVAKIDGQDYFLDASGKNNPFGSLPLYCYNGYARVIDKNGTGIYLNARATKERNVNTVTVDSIGRTGYQVTINSYMGKYHSRALRNLADGDTEKLKRHLEQTYGGSDYAMSDLKLSYFDDPDTNLIVKLVLRKSFKEQTSKLYFDLDYMKIFTENPFVAMTRRLPIEFPSQIEEVYVLKATLPENVVPEDLPKPALLTYEENKMIFRHLIGYDKESRSLSVNTKFQANETVFPVEAYETIRKFFEQMIQEVNHTLVLNIGE